MLIRHGSRTFRGYCRSQVATFIDWSIKLWHYDEVFRNQTDVLFRIGQELANVSLVSFCSSPRALECPKVEYIKLHDMGKLIIKIEYRKTLILRVGIFQVHLLFQLGNCETPENLAWRRSPIADWGMPSKSPGSGNKWCTCHPKHELRMFPGRISLGGFFFFEAEDLDGVEGATENWTNYKGEKGNATMESKEIQYRTFCR